MRKITTKVYKCKRGCDNCNIYNCKVTVLSISFAQQTIDMISTKEVLLTKNFDAGIFRRAAI